MKKKYFTLLFLTTISTCFSQLYVGQNSYVYAKNALLYVKQDVKITENVLPSSINGKLYLRNEAQLLQGTTGTSANAGTGRLSVFQEGTVSQYCYNAWCSPVGNPSATGQNEPFDIGMFYVPTTNTLSNAATNSSSPVYDGTSSVGSLNIANYWIWKFIPNTATSTYSDWDFVGNTPLAINTGEGFTMKGTSGADATTAGESSPNKAGNNQRYDFRGKPNDGTISIPVLANQLTLMGNPYPSAIDLEKFLESSDAANSKRTAYFWEQSPSLTTHYISDYVGGYNTYSPGLIGTSGDGVFNAATLYSYNGSGVEVGTGSTSSNSYNRMFLPIGQGFMIEGSANGSVQMKNSYRVFVKEGLAPNLTQFAKNNNNSVNEFFPEIQSVSGFDYSSVSLAPVPQIKFITSFDTNFVGHLTLALSDNASDNVDIAADAESPNETETKEIYFAINQQNIPYCINYTNFDINKRIPLGIRTNENTPFKIKMEQMINFDGASNVYLHDKITDEYFDITTEALQIDMPAGDNTTRFEITFQNSTLSTPSNTTSTLTALQNNTNQTLNINNPKSLDLKSVTLYDVSGKLIFNKTSLGSKTNYEFSTASLSEGVYLVKIDSTDNQHFGEKIIINHVK